MLVYFENRLQRRKFRQAAGRILVIIALSFPVSFDSQGAPAPAARENVATNSNGVSVENSPSLPPPVPSATKTKAGFLAAAGLVILSLLILACGLALLRAFKQR
jgi:hypothetical protein